MEIFGIMRQTVIDGTLDECWIHDQLFASKEDAIAHFRNDMRYNLESFPDDPSKVELEIETDEDEVLSVVWKSPDQEGWVENCHIIPMHLPK